MNAVPRPDTPIREQFYQDCKRHLIRITPTTEWICQMLASWQAGLGALPDGLGLPVADFMALQKTYFCSPAIRYRAPSGQPGNFERMLERDDLIRYLFGHAIHPERDETRWITYILVAGCLGDDHLWQDLGLWSRRDLSQLIGCHYPAIAQANSQDMKWKKFLYKQLCEAEGIYVCRAPSCALCVDYPRCFGPED
jgi:nitrogen fixation protein NifQ